MKRILFYTRFERFWHWGQALLVIALAVTGFEVHGTFEMLGFQKAVEWHNRLAWALAALIAFAVFWHCVTDEWGNTFPPGRS